MLNYKDIIKLTAPVKARIEIGYNAPFSDSIDTVLEEGEVLQLEPFGRYMSFRVLWEDREAFKEKYFTEGQHKEPYYRGFSVDIDEDDLGNHYEIIEKTDLTKLDLTINDDKWIFTKLYLEHINDPNHEVIARLHLPEALKTALAELVEEHYLGSTSSNATLRGYCFDLLYGHYNKKED